MAIQVQAMGIVLEDGGTFVLAAGCAPGGTVEWALTAGSGTLTPLTPVADGGGVAVCHFKPGPGTAGQTATVEARSYA